MIFQAEVPRAYELRISVFGERVFAAKLEPQSALADVDWRMDKGSDWQPYDLPEDVSESVLQLLRELRLDYGMVDMRVTPAGEYVFFEVNPSGQFVFIEIETGLPVCRAMADLLIERAGAAGRGTRPGTDLSRLYASHETALSPA